MTFQYTEHPTHKIELVVDAPTIPEKDDIRKGANVGASMMNIVKHSFIMDGYKEALSKCERIKITNPQIIPSIRECIINNKIDHYRFNDTNARLKDGDTFEIDDEKVSVEFSTRYIEPDDSIHCNRGYDQKIATLKLKETVKGVLDITSHDPYPITDILPLLIRATEILLYKKDYDGPDYEEMMQAVKYSRLLIKKLESNSQPTTQGK